MNARDELREAARGEISHHISPVIGWLRMDAVKGRDDSDRQRLTAFEERLGKAADAIVELVESRKPRTITTVLEVEALTPGTRFLAHGILYTRVGPSRRVRSEFGMEMHVDEFHYSGFSATVLHEPEAAK